MKKKNAYLTVEAVMVLPITISAILVVIFLLIYQYNRCLLEQDVGTMALWGSTVELREDITPETMVQSKMQERYTEKYVVWENTEWKATLEENEFAVTGEGSLTFPVPGWNIWNDENVWNAEAEYRFDRLDEITFIRLCNRFLNKEETEDAAEAE